jgi:hypothetical protein
MMRANEDAKLQQGGPSAQHMTEIRIQQGM